ncbi:MAG: homoserine kinase [Anaerolineales bacterium]|nr:homoserine kinase [Anaerolineales bacterium]
MTVPATTANLGPGFDCLGLALGLYNVVVATADNLAAADAAQPTDLTITTSGEGATQLATDTTNLVYRAADCVFTQVGKRPLRLHLHLENNIPIGSGLGSSGAAVVAGLLVANTLLDNPLSFADVQRLAIGFEGHPDNVVAALHGGLILAVHDEADWHIEPISLPAQQVIIVLPDFDFPTAAARAALPDSLPRADAIFNHSRLPLLLRALETADYAKLALAMQDRMHQPYRLPLVSGLAAAMQAAQAAGAAGVALSGAGPSLVAFAPAHHEAVAAAAQAAFATAGLDSRAWILPIAQQGAVVTTAS